MVQAKAKRRGSSVRKFLDGVRCGYLSWLTQSARRWRTDAAGSVMSAMREVRISRQRLRRLERQGPMFEILEPRLLLSALPTPFATSNTDSFPGLYSTDGVNWTAINATPIGITFTQSTNLAGLAVASGNPSQSQAVNFNSFSATPTNFTDQGIGTPSIAGSSTYDPSTGNWTVKGGGADIYGSGDQFNFALGFTTYVAAETVDPEPQPAYVDLAQFNWQTNYSATMTNGSWQIAAGSGFSPAGAGAFTLANPGSFVPITSGTAANIAFANETWD